MWIFENGESHPASPRETFARFQAGFSSSEEFHRFIDSPSLFIDFYDLRGFTKKIMDFDDVHGFRVWILQTVRANLLPL